MKQVKEKKYYGFVFRIFKDLLSFILFFVLSLILLSSSLLLGEKQSVNYREKSNLDYKVYLNENDFYDEPYLNKDMLYIANLIDKINIDFDYNFEIDSSESLDFTYDIIGKLSITNVAGTKLFYEKDYTLVDEKKIEMIDTNLLNIKRQISIDYSYYNDIANKFKNSYGLDSESKFTIYMNINKKSNEHSSFNINNNKSMSVVIPLSERAIDIKLDYNNINEVHTIEKDEIFAISNPILLIISIVLFILSVIMLIKFIKMILLLFSKKSIYDKHVNKILKEYDRLIAESSSLVSFDDKEVVKIKKFTELLDIHDNLQLPILYYSIAKHQKCYFYISSKDIIYLYVVKAIDLEVEDSEKKEL